MRVNISKHKIFPDYGIAGRPVVHGVGNFLGSPPGRSRALERLDPFGRPRRRFSGPNWIVKGSGESAIVGNFVPELSY